MKLEAATMEDKMRSDQNGNYKGMTKSKIKALQQREEGHSEHGLVQWEYGLSSIRALKMKFSYRSSTKQGHRNLVTSSTNKNLWELNK